jgi:hypothetical protein
MKTKLFVAFSAIAIVAAANAQMLEIGARYWQMTPSGVASVGADGIEGTEIDLKDDLGYGSKENVLGFDASFGSGIQIAVSYLALDLSARNRIDRTIRFGDTLYRARADVSSAIEADLLRAAYRYQRGSYGFSGGFLLGVQLVELNATASARGFGEASESADATLPVIGALVRIDPSELVRIDLVIAGGAWDFDRTRIAFWDGEANVRINLHPLFVGIGYRRVSIDGEDSDIPLDADVTFQGPQVIGGFAF